MVCNKCRQREALAGDTWCIVCSAWESLGNALVGKWGTAAVRSVADEVLVAAARHTRELRNLDAGLAARAKSEASKPKRPEIEGSSGARGSGKSRERSPLPRPRSVAPDSAAVKAEPASEYTYETDSGSEGQGGPRALPGSLPPPEPLGPPPGREGEKVVQPHPKRPREEKRDKKVDKEHHKKEKKDKRRRKRGGRKHKRLERQLDNPQVKVHRALPPEFWDQSLERRSHLSPPRR